MGKHTQLNRNYWRYLIIRKGRKYARSHFHWILKRSKEGERKDALIEIYKSVGFGRVGGE